MSIPSAERPSVDRPSADRPSSGADSRATILCVDDEAIVLTSLRRQLREVAPDHRIEVATSGGAALEAIDRLTESGRAIALLITDQQMPGMPGDELLARAAKLVPDTYQVMLTGQATADAVGRAVNQGRLFRYLAKPWTVEDLGLTVAKALEAYARDRQLAIRTEQLQRAHERSLAFVPHEYLRLLGRERLEEVIRGDACSARVSVLFADLRGFTSLIESMGPEEAFRFMNEYFANTEPAVHGAGGFVDHYAGDGTMAIFSKKASFAVRAAIDFVRAVERMSAARIAAGHLPMNVGIGVHTGDVIVGVKGGDKKLQCGVVGDCVNACARIEGLTSRYGARILASSDTLADLGSDPEFSTREIDRIRVKGKREPLTVFEVLDALPEPRAELRRATQTDFESGLRAMRSGNATEALGAFARVLSADPDDVAAHVHLDACHDLLRGRSSADEDGIITLKEKRW